MFKMHKDGTIVLPQGDTMKQIIELTGREFPTGTVAVFGVIEHMNATKRQVKAFEVKSSQVIIELTSDETKKLKPGEYMWDLRIVTNPEWTEDGAVKSTADSMVQSVFSGSRLPTMIVTEVAADV